MAKKNVIGNIDDGKKKKKDPRDTRNSFYIENKSEKLKNEITAIAKHKGQTVTNMLRGMIIKLRDDSPPEKLIWNGD